MNRYFAATPEVYEQARAQLNAAFGYPDGRGTDSVFVAAEHAYKADGKCLLWGQAEWCEWPEVAPLLNSLLDEGLVTEISEAAYWAAAPKPPYQ